MPVQTGGKVSKETLDNNLLGLPVQVENVNAYGASARTFRIGWNAAAVLYLPPGPCANRLNCLFMQTASCTF
jgi:hypothetical protein